MKNSRFVPLAAASAMLAAPAVLVVQPFTPFDNVDRLAPPPAALDCYLFSGQSQSLFDQSSIFEMLDQYALDLLGVPAAHEYATGSGMIVAVLDTGVYADHEMLTGRVLPGFNFVDNSTDTSDKPDGVDNDGDGETDELTGHGTWLAGVILLTAPDAAILPVTVLDSDGAGTVTSLVNGINYAVVSGAHVINISLASTTYSQAVADAVAAADAAGVLVVASVSNSNRQQPVCYPAAVPQALAVASTDAADYKSTFSDYGQYVDISAPGTDIVGPIPDNGYGRASGASAAAAWLSGAAALLLQDANTESPRAFVTEVLGQTADDLDALNPDYAGLLGLGRLDVAQAVGLVAEAHREATGSGVTGSGDTYDLVVYLDHYFHAEPEAERTSDTTINEADLNTFLTDWSASP